MTGHLFFGLMPPPTVRASLALLGAALEGQDQTPVARDNLHLTLAFAGSVNPAQRVMLMEAASRVLFPPFVVRLDRMGYFAAARALWVGPRICPPPLAALAHTLASLVADETGRVPEADYVPHVTLARHVATPLSLPLGPVDWPVDAFALLCSRSTATGVCYDVLAVFPSRPSPGVM